MGCCELYGAVLSYTGLYWDVLGSTGLYWAVLGCTGPCWTILGCTGVYWTVLGSAGGLFQVATCGPWRSANSIESLIIPHDTMTNYTL